MLTEMNVESFRRLLPLHNFKVEIDLKTTSNFNTFFHNSLITSSGPLLRSPQSRVLACFLFNFRHAHPLTKMSVLGRFPTKNLSTSRASSNIFGLGRSVMHILMFVQIFLAFKGFKTKVTFESLTQSSMRSKQRSQHNRI
jgi:hypothetical protein